jgi:2-methylcitrate dehydratase PrpD
MRGDDVGATATLAEAITTTTRLDVSGAVMRSLLDTRCAMVAGRSTVGGRAVAATADELADTSPAMLAWVWAATATASRMDDAVPYGAAGAPVWGALLALATDIGIADEVRIAAAGEAGLQAALALWRAGGYRQAERGFDGTSVFGVLAAAMACAQLLDLDQNGILRALSIAASHSGGLLANSGTTAETVHAGTAARDGLLSALLAAADYSGAPDILEGRQGFGEAFFGLPNSRLQSLGTELATAPSLDEQLRSKWIPGHIDHQRPVLALAAILATAGDRGIRAVVVDGVPPTSDGNRFSTPTSSEQAAGSLRYALACTLRHGVVRLADHAPHILDTAPLARIEVRSSPRWDRRLENPNTDALHVAVEFEDGDICRAAVDDFPLGASLDEVRDKWQRTAEELVPSVLSDELHTLLGGAAA